MWESPTTSVGDCGSIDMAPKKRTYTKRHQIYRLLYVEPFQSILEAIAREKQLKSWKRVKKESLIDRINPDRIDLAAWVDDGWPSVTLPEYPEGDWRDWQYW